MDDQLVNDVSGWLMALSTLVAGKLNLDEIRLRLGSYVPLLADEFPNSRYFTSESLRYVARHSKWFPSYGELCDLLSASWKQDDAGHPMLPSPGRESTQPYQLPPPPDWCFQKSSPHFDGKASVISRPPERTVEEQLRALKGDA